MQVASQPQVQANHDIAPSYADLTLPPVNDVDDARRSNGAPASASQVAQASPNTQTAETTPSQAQSLSVIEIKQLTPEQIKQWQASDFARMDEENIRFVTVSQGRALGDRYLELTSEENKKNLTDYEQRCLSTFRKSKGFVVVMYAQASPKDLDDSDVQRTFGAMSASEVGAVINAVTLEKLKPEQLRWLKLEGLDPEHFNMLSDAQWRALTREQLQSLQLSQLMALSDKQLEKIDLTALSTQKLLADPSDRLLRAYKRQIERNKEDERQRGAPPPKESIYSYIPDVPGVRAWPRNPENYAKAQQIWEQLQNSGVTWRDLNEEISDIRQKHGMHARYNHVNEYPRSVRERLQELLEARHKLQQSITAQRKLMEQLGCTLMYSDVPDPARRIGFVPEENKK